LDNLAIFITGIYFKASKYIRLKIDVKNID
jgi:hypothetical protein